MHHFISVFSEDTGPWNSPHVSLLLSARTRVPWLEVIEGHTRVKCCCSPHHTPASPELCAIVHLHTNTRNDSEAREMAKNCRDLLLAEVDCSTPIYCHSRSTSYLSHLQLQWHMKSSYFFIFSLVLLKNHHSLACTQYLSDKMLQYKFTQACPCTHTVILYTNHQFAAHCTAGLRCHGEHPAAWIVYWDGREGIKDRVILNMGWKCKRQMKGERETKQRGGKRGRKDWRRLSACW